MWQVRPTTGLAGEARVPPDKSISHRAAMMGAIAEGTTVIDRYLEAADTLATLESLRAFGVEVDGPDGQGRVVVRGRPASRGGLAEPERPVDAGNSGTTLRLLMGLAAAHPIFWVATGDASLRRRPMGRVIEPLSRMGARIWARQGDRAPLAMRGGPLRAIAWRGPVASAQVKSAVLLAGVQARGVTRVDEPALSRDHTERMLPLFGVRLFTGPGWVELEGPQTLQGCHLTVPGDPSSAAFLWVAAAMHPGSRVRVSGVSLNPTRVEVLRVLSEMGAQVQVEPGSPPSAPEPWGDVTVIGPGRLRPFRIAGRRVPLLIDELPVLAVAALRAQGTSLIQDASELRVKESDRIEALARGLAALGAQVEALPDGLRIEGPQRLPGGVADSCGDHRLAMSLAVAALAGDGPSVVKGSRCARISFPGFAEVLDLLARAGGGRIEEAA